MSHKLIIDADPGIGDALAIALACLDPQIELLGVTAVSGCVSGPVATQNIFTLTEAIDPPRLPRLGASTSPRPDFSVGGYVPEDFLDPLKLNGNYGLGLSEVPFAPLHSPRDSARLIVDLVCQHPHEVTLLTLGPLSNVALALESSPKFASQLRRLICLGGSVACGGDATAAAEFNIFADPGAARAVLRSQITRTLVPLDVSTRPILTFDLFNRLQQSRPWSLRWLFDELLPFSLRTWHEQLGLEGFPLQAVTALCALVEPRHFRSDTLPAEVETVASFTRGATVFDRRRPGRWRDAIDVITDIDPQGVLDYLQSLVGNP